MSSDEEIAPRRKHNTRLIRDEDDDEHSETSSSSFSEEEGSVNIPVEEDEESQSFSEEEEESEWEEIPQELLLEGCGRTSEPKVPNSRSPELVESGSESNVSDGQADRCPVCLNRFLGQEVGTPESCDHAFCLDCIQEWAKNVNTCPVDRSVFKLILVRKGEKVVRRLAIEKSDKEVVEEDLTYCEVCGECDREDRLLLCDGCDLGYHCECLTPPLEDVPVEEWYCPECSPEYTSRLEDQVPEDVFEDFRQMVEGRFRMGSRRVIARTRASELVRTRIERRRAAESGLVTPLRWSTQRSSNGRSNKTRRKRRSTKSRKKPWKRHKCGNVSGRRRRTKKQRRRKRRHTTSFRSRQSARPLSKPPSVRQRIAEKLGLRKPPPGHCLPLMRHTDVTATGYTDSSVSSLSIFGERDELISWDDSGNDGIVLAATRAQHHPTNSQMRQKLLKPTPPLDRIRTALSRPSTAPACGDVLGSILQTQRVLLGRETTRHAIIQRDGSLDLRSVPWSALRSRPRSPGCSAGSSSPPSSGGNSVQSVPTQLGGNSTVLVGSRGDGMCSSGFSGDGLSQRDCGGGQQTGPDLLLLSKGKEISKNGTGTGDSEDEVDIYSDIESIGDDQQHRGHESQVPLDGPVGKVLGIHDSQKRTDDSGDDSSENELVIDEEENDSGSSPVALIVDDRQAKEKQESDQDIKHVHNGEEHRGDDDTREAKVPSRPDYTSQSLELRAKSSSCVARTDNTSAPSSPTEAVEDEDGEASVPSSPIDISEASMETFAICRNQKTEVAESTRSSLVDVEDLGDDGSSPSSPVDVESNAGATATHMDVNEMAEPSSPADKNESSANEAVEISTPSPAADVIEKCEGSSASSTLEENGEEAKESGEGKEEALEIESPPAEVNLGGTEDITSPEYEPSVADGEEEEEGLISEPSRDGIEEVSEPGSGDELFGAGTELPEPEPLARQEPPRSKGRSCRRHKHRRKRRSHDDEREEGEIVEASSRRKKNQDEMDDYVEAGPRINISELPRIPKLKRAQELGHEATPDSKRTSVLGRVDAGSSSEISWKRLSKHSRERSYRDGKHKDEKLMFKEREIRKKEKDKRLQQKNQNEEDIKPKKERKPDRELYVRPDKRRDWSRKEKASSKDRKDKHKEKYSRDRHGSREARCESKDKRHSGRHKRSCERSKDADRKHKEHKESKRKEDRNLRRMEEKAKAILEKKEKDYWKEKRSKHPPSPLVQSATPIEHKEVFTKGNSIIINVNFNRKLDEMKESRKRASSPEEEPTAKKKASSNHYDTDSKDEDEPIAEDNSESPAYDNHVASESEYEQEVEPASRTPDASPQQSCVCESSADAMPPPVNVPVQSPPRSPSPPSPPEDNSYDPCEPTKSPSPPPPTDPVPPPEPELPPLPPEPEPEPKMVPPTTPPPATYTSHVQQLPSLHLPPPAYVLPPRNLQTLVASLRAPWPAAPMFAPSHLLGLRGAFPAPTTLLGPPVGILPPHAAVVTVTARPTMILPPENATKLLQPETTQVVDMEVDSPYSPPDSPAGAAQEKERPFDTLLPTSRDCTRTKGSHKKHRSGSKERKQIVHFVMEKGVRPKVVEGRMDESQLKVLDELPSSAVEMQVKEKFMKKLNRQERVVEEVKLSLKPYYNRREITKEEYKDVLRKSVPKICHNRSGEINPVKIRALVEGYVKKVKYQRKKPSSAHKSKAAS